jgi:hypothetical protein
VRKPPTGRAATVPMERPATAAYASRRRRFSLPQSREGSGRRRCGRDGWFAAKRPPRISAELASPSHASKHAERSEPPGRDLRFATNWSASVRSARAHAFAWRQASDPTPPALRSPPRPAQSLARDRFAEKRASGTRPRRVARRSRYRPNASGPGALRFAESRADATGCGTSARLCSAGRRRPAVAPHRPSASVRVRSRCRQRNQRNRQTVAVGPPECDRACRCGPRLRLVASHLDRCPRRVRPV